MDKTLAGEAPVKTGASLVSSASAFEVSTGMVLNLYYDIILLSHSVKPLRTSWFPQYQKNYYSD